MKKLIYISLFVLLLTSCKVVEYVPIESKVEIKERIVKVDVPADSSSIIALLECDSLNQVILKQLNEKNTDDAQSNFTLKNNVVSVKFKSNPKPKVIVRDTTIYKDRPYPVKTEKTVYKTKWYQDLLMYVGLVALIALLLIIIIYAKR